MCDALVQLKPITFPHPVVRSILSQEPGARFIDLIEFETRNVLGLFGRGQTALFCSL
jgi:hypothetical protein